MGSTNMIRGGAWPRLVPLVGLSAAVCAAALGGCGDGSGGADGPDAADAAAMAEREAIEAILEAVQTAYRTGELERAGAMLAAAAEQYPGDQDIWAAHGTLLLQRERHAEAHAAFVRALEIGPATAELAMSAGTTASVIGRDASAAEYFARAVELEPSDVGFLMHLGQAEVEAGLGDRARVTLGRVIGLDDGHAMAWAALAELELREGDPAAAMEAVGAARRLEPDELNWKSIEARAARAMGDCDRVIALLDPLGVPARYEPGIAGVLAGCLEEVGRGDEAARLRVEAAAWFAEDD